MNPDFVLQNVGETIIYNIMEKRIRITLFVLFTFFGVRQLLVFWDIWAGVFLCALGLLMIFSEKKDIF
jgi:hypothetical protein